jgi:hypothetical protein
MAFAKTSSMLLVRSTTLAFLVVLGALLRIESDTRWLQFHYDQIDSVAIAHHSHDAQVARTNRRWPGHTLPGSSAIAFSNSSIAPMSWPTEPELRRPPLGNRTIVSLLGRLRL